jgi:hypothetical protein
MEVPAAPTRIDHAASSDGPPWRGSFTQSPAASARGHLTFGKF